MDLFTAKALCFDHCVIRRVARALGTYVSRSPVTAGYAGLLLSTHLWCAAVLSTAEAQRVVLGVSTNLDNLQDRPVRVLAGSMLFFDGTLTEITSEAFAGTLITLGLGVIVCLAWLERRYGAGRAYALFVLGHLGATLLTVPLIHVALAHGWYPDSVRHATDFGISYGAETVLATGRSCCAGRGGSRRPVSSPGRCSAATGAGSCPTSPPSDICWRPPSASSAQPACCGPPGAPPRPRCRTPARHWSSSPTSAASAVPNRRPGRRHSAPGDVFRDAAAPDGGTARGVVRAMGAGGRPKASAARVRRCSRRTATA